MRILIDVDDTIELLVAAWCEELNRRYGTDVHEQDITDWDMSKFFPSLTPGELYGVLDDEELWRNVKPDPGAVKYVKRLIDDGHEIKLVTASGYVSLGLKYKYVIKEHFPYIGWGDIIVCKDKQMILGDFLIDDGVHNLIGGDRRVKKILLTRPHNASFRDGLQSNLDVIKRAKDWEEVYHIIALEVHMRNQIFNVKK